MEKTTHNNLFIGGMHWTHFDMRRKSTTPKTYTLEGLPSDQPDRSQSSDELSYFQNSLLLMNVVKKCERLIFKERENEMQSNLEMINRQN